MRRNHIRAAGCLALGLVHLAAVLFLVFSIDLPHHQYSVAAARLLVGAILYVPPFILCWVEFMKRS